MTGVGGAWLGVAWLCLDPRSHSLHDLLEMLYLKLEGKVNDTFIFQFNRVLCYLHAGDNLGMETEKYTDDAHTLMKCLMRDV